MSSNKRAYDSETFHQIKAEERNELEILIRQQREEFYRDQLNQNGYGYGEGELRPHWFDSTKGYEGDSLKIRRGENHGQWAIGDGIIAPCYLDSPYFIPTYRDEATGEYDVRRNYANRRESHERASSSEPSTLEGDSPTGALAKRTPYVTSEWQTGRKHRTEYDKWLAVVSKAYNAMQRDIERAEGIRNTKQSQMVLARVKKGKKLSIRDAAHYQKILNAPTVSPAPYKGEVGNVGATIAKARKTA